MSWSFEQLQDEFAHHPPRNQGIVNAHQRIREACLDLALVINRELQDGHKKEHAIDSVREAMHWANSSIAVEGTDTSPREDRPRSTGSVLD